MDGNDRPNRSKRVHDILIAGHIDRLNWPAKSPDINPIENMWNNISGAIHIRVDSPQIADELVVAATEEWNNRSKDIINRLTITMHRCVNMLFQRGGSHTDY